MDLMQWMEEQGLELTPEQQEELARWQEEKAQLEQELQQVKEQLRLEKEQSLNHQNQLQMEALIEQEVRKRGAINPAVVVALLDKEALTLGDGTVEGLAEQLDALMEDEETAFLFERKHIPHFVSTGRNAAAQKEKTARRVMGLSR